MDNTKTKIKQSASPASENRVNTLLDYSLLALEDACVQLLETDFVESNDSERMYWQQRFSNIVTKVSLALAEVRGPRHFHQHYRHDIDDDTILLPVLENSMDMLAHACEFALQESSEKLSSIHDDDLISAKRLLEKSLNNFLLEYNK